MPDEDEAQRERRRQRLLEDLTAAGWSPDDVAQVQADAARRARLDDKTYAREEKRVRAALAAVGVDEADLLQTTAGDAKRASAAVPVLLSLLAEVTDIRLKEVLVRALTTRHARPLAAERLLREFRETADETYAWAVANALTMVVAAEHFEALATLVFDARKGRAREPLPEAIAATKHPKAVDALVSLLGDPQIAGHAVAALRHRWLRDPRVPLAVGQFRDHPTQWIRSAAKRILAQYAST